MLPSTLVPVSGIGSNKTFLTESPTDLASNSTFKNITQIVEVKGITNPRTIPSNVTYPPIPDLPENVPDPHQYNIEKEEVSKELPTKRSFSLSVPQGLVVNDTIPVPVAAPLNNTENDSVLTEIRPGRIQFDGISELTSKCGGCVPPDVQIAVGPNGAVIQMVNVAIIIGKHPNYNPICSTGLSFDLRSFFQLDPGHPNIFHDPRVVYDASSGRWFASVADFTMNSVLVAVSRTSDPFGQWKVYSFPFTNCPDRPNIGFNGDIFAISANMYTNHCASDSSRSAGMDYILIDKVDLLSWITFPVSLTSHIARPAVGQFHTLYITETPPGAPLFMLGVERLDSTQSFVRLYSFTRSISDPNFSMGFSILALPIQSVNIPPPADQPLTDLKLSTTDFRVQDADYLDGKIWLAFNDACMPEEDTQRRSCFRLVELDVAFGSDTVIATVDQDFDVRFPTRHVFYPTLEIMGDGTIGVGFGLSGTDIYPSLLFATHSPTEPRNTITEQAVVKKGSDSYTNPTRGVAIVCQNLMACRYGDYFGSAVDPNNPSVIWISGEYIKDRTAYSTYISQIRVVP